MLKKTQSNQKKGNHSKKKFNLRKGFDWVSFCTTIMHLSLQNDNTLGLF